MEECVCCDQVELASSRMITGGSLRLETIRDEALLQKSLQWAVYGFRTASNAHRVATPRIASSRDQLTASSGLDAPCGCSEKLM